MIFAYFPVCVTEVIEAHLEQFIINIDVLVGIVSLRWYTCKHHITNAHIVPAKYI